MQSQRLKLIVCLALALALGPASAHAGYDQALAAFEAGNYPVALKELRPLAEKGDARSQYALGVMAENGFGMAKNLPQAAAWYLKAAKQGNTDAQYNLGAMYEHGIGMPANPVQAARWYRPAAEGGDIDAISNLGVLYEKGQGVPQDRVLAMALYNVSVAYDPNKGSQAARNRQGLANRMPLEDVRKAGELTDELLKPNNFKPALGVYLGRRLDPTVAKTRALNPQAESE
ncbi:MAG: sel1 repeat family protein [Arenimonas sp.]|nr:sel1 repeat family protein [Arenimonas sp.]